MVDIIAFGYKAAKEAQGVLYILHTLVDFPNGETVKVVSEFTDYGNRFTVRQAKQRLCFVESPGDFHVHFRTLGGFEVMVRAKKKTDS